MYLGIDLGTSSVKVIVTNECGDILASASSPLNVSRPHPLWSEQEPTEWFSATTKAVREIANIHDLSLVKAIGLSGQMHGATLLDKKGNCIRPAILWNDGRSQSECELLEKEVPNSRQITGNIMMPGFTAPKVKWVQQNEPKVFAQIDKVLLPKDYLRFCLTGEFGTDMSDAAGTMWLDVGKREWNQALLAATGLNISHMPKLYEGNQITGYLNDNLALKWGMHNVPVVAGGGDNAAGAIGAGIIKQGQSMLSLGTSGVYFAVSDRFTINPESALHSFCHALPNTWHTMSVILSAASCLDWVVKLVNYESVSEMLNDVESNANPESNLLFLPYLSGERTPHNDPLACGVFYGLNHNTTRSDMAQAVLQGVGFALADGLDALHVTGQQPEEITLIGGGTQSHYWRQMLCDIFAQPLTLREGGNVGPALGAARLAQLAITESKTLEEICPTPRLLETHQPNMIRHHHYSKLREKFTQLYQATKHIH